MLFEGYRKERFLEQEGLSHYFIKEMVDLKIAEYEQKGAGDSAWFLGHDEVEINLLNVHANARMRLNRIGAKAITLMIWGNKGEAFRDIILPDLSIEVKDEIGRELQRQFSNTRKTVFPSERIHCVNLCELTLAAQMCAGKTDGRDRASYLLSQAFELKNQIIDGKI